MNQSDIEFDSNAIWNKLIQCESNTTILFDDLSRLLSVFAKRGTNIDKILQTTIMSAAEALRGCVIKYDIKKRAHTSSCITLGRLANLYPFPIIMAANNYLFESPIGLINEYPPYMRTTVFAACVSHRLISCDMMLLRKVYFIHQYAFNKIIHPKNPKTKGTIMKFICIQTTNTNFLEQKETMLVDTLKIAVFSGEFLKLTEDTVALYNRILDSVPNEDKYSEPSFTASTFLKFIIDA